MTEVSEALDSVDFAGNDILIELDDNKYVYIS